MPKNRKPFTPKHSKEPARIRDIKGGDWYWIRRNIIKLHAKDLGSSGIAVYNALTYYADSKTQVCFPTRKTIAHVLGLSRRTVTRKINLLENLGLIAVEKTGISYRYFLYESPLEWTKKTGTEDKKSTSQATLWNTNNNQITRVNNNNRKNKYFKASKRCIPKSKEELLACDLAEALNDDLNFGIYLFYTKKYPETFLRRTLGEVKEMPAEKIKKGRAALFHYLIKKHAPKTTEGFRD